jgi:hypothetical protein
VSLKLECAFCHVYDREERFDGHNDYTVCRQCGRSELRLVESSTNEVLAESGTEFVPVRPD